MCSRSMGRFVAKVAIVGAGITGLAGAWFLSRQGMAVTVFEAEPRVGGALRTADLGGFRMEGGPDSLLVRKPAGVALAREVGLGDALIPTADTARGAYIFSRGQLHPIPSGVQAGVPTDVGALLRSSLISWPGKARILGDLVRPPGALVDDESLGGLLARRFGPEVVRKLAAPMLSGIYAGDIYDMSLAATFPQLRALEQRYGSLVRGMWAERRKRPPGGRPGPIFMTLENGLGSLPERLWDRMRDSVRWCLGTRIHRIRRSGSGYTLAGDPEGQRFDGVLVAVPAFQAANLLEEGLPQVASLLQAVPYANLAVVGLLYGRDTLRVPEGKTGLLVPEGEPDMAMTAATFLASKWAYRERVPYHPVRVFFGRAQGPNVLSWSDVDLVNRARANLTQALAQQNPEVLQHIVFRHPRAMPQYRVGHLARIQRVREAVAGWPGLVLAGAAYDGVGIPDCIESARRGTEELRALLSGA